MRTLLVVVSFQILLWASLVAQDLNREISISFQNVPFERVLSELGEQYDLKFSYSRERVGLNKKITLSVEQVRLNDALEKIFKQANVEYKMVGEQIVLRNKNNADSDIVVDGKVLDNRSGTPLPLASIRLDQTSLGVATNDDGAFVLHIPAQHRSNKITVSYVGYRSHHLSVSNDENSLLIRLEPETTQLNTVVVTSKTGHSILEEAIARIQENYDTGKVKYTYFIRDLAVQDGDPVEASETVYQAYRESAAPSAERQIKVVKGRRVKDFHAIQSILQTFIRWTGFEIGLGTDIIFSADLKTQNNSDEFPGSNFLKQHDFELLGTSLLDDREVYVISFDQKDAYKNKALYKGKFYIDMESLAFVRTETELSPKGIKHAKFFGTSKAAAALFGYSRCAVLGQKSITTYKAWQGKWYPASIGVSWNASLVKPKTDFFADILLTGDVVVTDIQTGNVKPFNSSEVLSPKDQRNWEYLYQFAFWDGINAVPPDATMENAFETIARKNKKYGLDMNFWRRYQPYKSDHALLVRDSILCQQVTASTSNSPRAVFSHPGDDNKLFAPKYPPLNRTLPTKHFVIHFLAGDSASAQDVASVVEKNYARVLGSFGIDSLPRPIHVEVYPGVENYHFAIGRTGAPDSDVGMAVDEELFKMVSPGHPGSYHTRESLLKAAVHEFAHCVHYQFIARMSASNISQFETTDDAAWLFEGMASYVAQQFYAPEKFEYLRTGPYPTLKELNDVDGNGKIYDVGFLLIEFIETTWEEEGLLNLLSENGDVKKTFGLSESEFESRFYNYVKRNFLK
ncbi:carboxypeptidase-like regulatory domain-containing protein [Chryseolinea soli]|uniref:DUF4974 domain-containing protein n=1 Tax=Chryseolinea soli TaxID=2321403 RepID=A0A385SXI4_9BACT|nr:carboxypeptidase-like regulatory domain-containing protein [Chryseolinea soli]AYB33458.1 DUF4974 domain-containing protein [Chryseolinea soli]